MPIDRMDLLAWIGDRAEAHPGEHLGGMTLIQEARGLPGEDADTARRWDGVARAAAQLHQLKFIDWRYVQPFNEVGETPHHAMDQQYVQRTENIMIRGEGYAALRDRKPADAGTTISITNSIIGQLALGDISNIDVFVILDAAERSLDQLEVNSGDDSLSAAAAPPNPQRRAASKASTAGEATLRC